MGKGPRRTRNPASTFPFSPRSPIAIKIIPRIMSIIPKGRNAFMKLPNIYTWPDRYLLGIPVAILVVSLLLIPNLRLGIDFTGGYAVTVFFDKPVGMEELERGIRNIVRASEVSITPLQGGGYVMEISEDERVLFLLSQGKGKEAGALREEISRKIREFLEKMGAKELSIQTVAPSLGSAFWDSALKALISAFVLLVLVIFFFFRDPFPAATTTFAMLYAAAVMLAAMAVAGIPLNMETLAIVVTDSGFSMDTDILLMTYLLKRKGDINDRLYQAFLTGMSLNIAAALSTLVILLVGFFTGNIIAFRMGYVLLMGLLADIPTTWMFNAAVLRKWVSRK